MDEEHDGWLRVRHRAAAGWLKKGQAVLLRDAVAYFTGRVRRDPRDADAYASRAWACHLTGASDKALKDLGEAIRLRPTAATFRHDRGALWQATGEYDKALADYSRAIRLDPNYAEAYFSRGTLRGRQRGQAAEALADLYEAIRLDPKYPQAFLHRGILRGRKRQDDKALADFNEALRLLPGYALAYANRGNVWTRKGEYGKALADFTDAIRFAPGLPQLYLDRGNIWEAKKEYVKALADYDKSVRVAPKNRAAYNGRAWLLATSPDPKIRDGKRAVASARRACELSGWKGAPDLDTLAAAYAEAGEFERAIRYERQAIEAAGPGADREGYRRRLKLYEAGKAYRLE